SGPPADGPRRLARLEPLPVATPLEPYDPSVARRLEVPGRDQDLLALQADDDRLASLPREIGIQTGAPEPVQQQQLHRSVRRYAEHERTLALRGDEDAHVAGRVAGCRHRGQLARQALLAAHELAQAEIGQRPHALRRVDPARGLKTGVVARIPVLLGH